MSNDSNSLSLLRFEKLRVLTERKESGPLMTGFLGRQASPEFLNLLLRSFRVKILRALDACIHHSMLQFRVIQYPRERRRHRLNVFWIEIDRSRTADLWQ